MVDKKTKHNDVLLLLKRNPELKRLVHTFFLRKIAKLGMHVNDFRDKNTTFHTRIWYSKNYSKALKYSSLHKALVKIEEDEASLVQYIHANIDQIPTDNDFELISKCTQPNLPYYAVGNQDRFFDVHLKVLKTALGDDYGRLEEKLLKETVNGETYTFPAINLLDSEVPLKLNNKLNLKDNSSTAVPDDFTSAIRSFMPKMQDNNTFTLHDLNLETNELTCSVSSYLKTLYSCDRWFYQMISAFPNDDTKEQTSYQKSKFLKAWSQNLRDIVINKTYSPDQSIGGSCLCIYNTDDGYEYLLGQKSSLANAFNELHVLPSFMFQPVSLNRLRFAEELSVKSKVFQELAEEVFKYDELEPDGHDRFIQKKINSKPEIVRLRRLLDEGRAKFHITGLWLDMYRLRPEITSVLVIKDKSWFEEFFTPKTKVGNWEILKFGVLNYATDSHSYEGLLSGAAGRLCAPGAAALVTGMRLFKNLDLE